jgi:glycosyltransferase involved in cell wall biosynthesis
MRILMLADFYPPVVGGLERVVADLSRALAARGHEVAVATLAHDGVATVEDDQGVSVHRLRGLAQYATPFFKDPNRRFAPPTPDPLLARQLAKLVREWHPDVIHAHGWSVYSYLPIKRRGGVPLVLTLHDYGNFCVRRDLLFHGATVCDGPTVRKCLSCAFATYGPPKALILAGGLALGRQWHGAIDRFVAISNVVAQQAHAHIAPDADIPILPSFVADAVTSYRPPATRSSRLPAGEYILFVGAFGRHKGVGTLLEAYAKLPDAPTLLLIGGKLGESPWPESGPPPGVQVIHDAPHELVLEAWANCQLGIVPSLWEEPLGLVALEALAQGKPLIASRIGGLTDIVDDGETGLLVPPGDATALRDAIVTLLADPALGQRLGAAGRVRVRDRFTAAVVVPKLETIYAELAGQEVVTMTGREQPLINELSAD